MNPFLIFVLSLIIMAGCNSEKKMQNQQAANQTKTEKPALVSPTIPVFDGEQAFVTLVRQTSFGPRNPNSHGHRQCREYLIHELRSSADRVQTQDFVFEGYERERLSLTNIFASFNVDATQRILLLAHWDTRPRAEHDLDKNRRNEPIIGANDGASGVAVLLQLAKMMQETRPVIGVDLLLTDGEDYGLEGDQPRYLLGARHFARTKDPGYVPRYAILLDMVGDKFLEIPQEQHSLRYAPDIIEMVWRTAQKLGYSQFVDLPGEYVTDDHLPLNEVGIKTINLIDFNYPDFTNRFWHTHEDTPDKCSPTSLEAVGTVLAHIIYSERP